MIRKKMLVQSGEKTTTGFGNMGWFTGAALPEFWLSQPLQTHHVPIFVVKGCGLFFKEEIYMRVVLSSIFSVVAFTF